MYLLNSLNLVDLLALCMFEFDVFSSRMERAVRVLAGWATDTPSLYVGQD